MGLHSCVKKKRERKSKRERMRAHPGRQAVVCRGQAAGSERLAQQTECPVIFISLGYYLVSLLTGFPGIQGGAA